MRSDADLWTYAVALYRAPHVADACLQLQEDSAVDVPVLLYACWMARRGARIGPDDVRRLDEAVGAWRAEVIHPLRAVRRRLKAGPPPAPSDRTDQLRNAVKAAELDAERIELAVLEEVGLATPDGAPVDAMPNLEAVVRHYRGREPDTDTRQLIATVAAAATAVSTPAAGAAGAGTAAGGSGAGTGIG